MSLACRHVGLCLALMICAVAPACPSFAAETAGKHKTKSDTKAHPAEAADKTAKTTSEKATKDAAKSSGIIEVLPLEPGAVEPLDAWIKPPDIKKPKAEKAPDPKNKKSWKFQPSAREEDPDAYLGTSYLAPLTPQARALRLKMAGKYGTVVPSIHELVRRDPRGKTDLRLCSVDMDGYKPGSRGKAAATEYSALKAIEAHRCDVVALQGVAGRTYSNLWRAVDGLAQKLYRRTDVPYYGIPGEVGKRYRGGGFLFNNDTVELEDISPQYGRSISSMDLFLNKPMVVRIKARGTDGGARSFVLVNFDLFTGSKRLTDESVERSMLMAELLRGFAAQLRRTFVAAPAPTIVLLGSRGGPRTSPGGEILGGRIRMANIEYDECTTSEDKLEIRCSAMPTFPQVLFGMVSDSYKSQVELLMLDKWGRVSFYTRKPDKKTLEKKRKERTGYSSEIYLFDSDLTLAYRHPKAPGQFASGIEPVKNGLASSPLVWTHLNW